MSQPEVAPYGSWASPISSDLIVESVVGLGGVAIDGEDVYWIESRPGEGGRNVVVRRSPDGTTRDANPQPFNARTRVHEYGGGGFLVHEGTVFFSNFADQRLYAVGPGEEPEPLTADVDRRYADMAADAPRNRLLAVRGEMEAQVELRDGALLVEGNETQGAAEAEKIRADADRQRQVIVAEAYRDAQKIKGEGDARSSAIFAEAFGRDPQFAEFYRSLEAYRAAFRNKGDVMVLDPSSEFFRAMRGSAPAAAPAAAKK